MWLSRHVVVATASRQVPNVRKQIVHACQTMSGRPNMPGRIFTHLSQIVYKLSEVVRPHGLSRQVATRCNLFIKNVCTKCLDLSGHTGCHGRSEQLVATGSATGSPRFKFQPCRAIIMSCRVANCRDTYVTNELYCRFARVSPCDWRHGRQPLLLLSAILWKTISYGRGEYPLRDVQTLFVLEIIHLFVTCYTTAADL